MAKGYDSLNDTFNTDGSVEVDAIVKADEVTKVDEIKKDYDYTRGNLYSLIEKGQEAINGIMEVAGETASPRAYEVAGQLIKSVADTPEGLIKKVQLDYYSDTNTRTASRVQRYTVVPKAKKDYNQDEVIDTDDTPFIEPGDDFGFTETSTFFGDGKEFAPNRGVDI